MQDFYITRLYPVFSSVSSLRIYNSILHRSLCSFLLPLFLKFSNSSVSFMRQRLREKLPLFLSCDSIISITLFSLSPSLMLFAFSTMKGCQADVFGGPKFSLIYKTKPAKFGSDHSLSALRTAFPQSITSYLSRMNFIFHFITYSA